MAEANKSAPVRIDRAIMAKTGWPKLRTTEFVASLSPTEKAELDKHVLGGSLAACVQAILDGRANAEIQKQQAEEAAKKKAEEADTSEQAGE